MSLDSLGEFLSALDAAGELVRVRAPVAVELELCAIADRVMKSPGGGKALVFEQPVRTVPGAPATADAPAGPPVTLSVKVYRIP